MLLRMPLLVALEREKESAYILVAVENPSILFPPLLKRGEGVMFCVLRTDVVDAQAQTR